MTDQFSAAIVGCNGLVLSKVEQDLFAEARPWGLILFQRNCQTSEQVSALTSKFREVTKAPNAPVFIDQEGGRVARLKDPEWRSYPPPGLFGDMFAREPQIGCEAAHLNAQIQAAELRPLGITVNCVPMADVRQPMSHKIIGDRAYGDTPENVIALARAVAEGAMAGGVLPVVKHVPGHGRALSDSHDELPRVDASREDLVEVDFTPFRALKDLPMFMTAHVLYTAYDSDQPATTSPIIIEEVIRGEIGFDGLLLSDDLSMNALEGSLAERTERSLAAGCDIALHCNGDIDEMREVLAHAGSLAGRAAERADATLAILPDFQEYNVEYALSRRDAQIAMMGAR